MSESAKLDCIFCGRRHDSLSALREHSGNCFMHPLYSDAKMWKMIVNRKQTMEQRLEGAAAYGAVALLWTAVLTFGVLIVYMVHKML